MIFPRLPSPPVSLPYSLPNTRGFPQPLHSWDVALWVAAVRLPECTRFGATLTEACGRNAEETLLFDSVCGVSQLHTLLEAEAQTLMSCHDIIGKLMSMFP